MTLFEVGKNTPHFPCPFCGRDIFFTLWGELGPNVEGKAMLKLTPVITRPHHCPGKTPGPTPERLAA